MVLVFGLILIGFVLGVVVVVAAEALGVLWIIKRLRTEKKRDVDKISSESLVGGGELDPRQSLNFAFKKQGVVWVLESDKVPKIWLDKTSREQKRKKEVVEVSPVKKYGKIKGQSLILTEPDGLHTTIQLNGCIVEAVSATSLSSKKWETKFPIKVESKTSAIYNGSKTFYLYLETSWGKEGWCKALRLASCDQPEKFKWFVQLHEEFQSYLISLNAEYYSFMKPSVGSSIEAIDMVSKPDSGPSKVLQFLKKLSKKTSKVGLDNKSTWTSLSGREDRKNTEKLRACQDAVLAISLMKNYSKSKHLKSSIEDDAPPLSSNSSHSGSQGHNSVGSGADSDEKFGIDEGTLCWNLLISRLFFDVKGNAQLKRSMQARIQKTLSSIRTPSYVGEVICTDINTGKLPPCITGMRALPMEMSEVWAFEVDIEYSGGALLEIETRLEVRELGLNRGIEDASSVGDVPSDLLEGFEYFGKQLNLAEDMSDLQEPKEDDDCNTDASKSTTYSSNCGSRWKSILNSVAKHVSQVPLSLAIRVASLRGTLRVHIKPPPSNQLWFSFTSMPDIDFKLESSVGEHKITSGHIAFFLINRIKAAIRENMVLPNCENVSIPWMIAENDDWVPFNVAPFIWIKQESGNETSTSINTPNQPSGGVNAGSEASARTSSNDPEHEVRKPKSAEFSQEPARKSADSLAVPSSFVDTLRRSSSLEELRKPLLEKDEVKPEEARDLKELKVVQDVLPQETRDLKEMRPPSSQDVKPQETEDLKEPRPPLLEYVKPQETRDMKEWRSPSLQNVKPQESSKQEMEDNSECQSTPKNVKPQESSKQEMEDNSECQSTPKSVNLLEKQDTIDDTRPKKMGRREKMFDLRKRMSEKFEEKKRHIEEKSRHIVEKMRGP